MLKKQLSKILEGGLFKDGDWIESKDQDPNGQIRLIQLADIGDGIFIDKSARYINSETAKKLKCTFLKEGDILVARMPDPLGRCCVFPLKGENKYVTAVDVCIIRPPEKFDNSFLAYMINSRFNRSEIERQSTGTTRKRISRKRLGTIEIPSFPKETQKQIAQILDNAVALREKTKQLVTEYDALAQSVFLDMFGDPLINKKNWKILLFKDVLEIRNGKNQNKVKNPNGKFPIYGSGGIMDYADDYISEENSVIIGRKGSINNPILVREKYWHVDTAFGLNPFNEKLDFNYLFFFCRRYNFEQHNKTVTIPSLTKAVLLEIKIPIPPISLQNQFAAKIKIIEQQKELAKQELKESEDLFNCLLQKAFKGELV